MPPRVLILTASVGEGHDRPALHLADQLRAERPVVDADVVDCLPALGRTVTAIGATAPRLVFYRAQWLWDVGYWAFAGSTASRALTQRLLLRLAGPGLLRLLAEYRPDVVVSLYPTATEVLGELKRDGAFDIPLVAGITDLAAMHYWASPGADLHLATHPESIEEIRSVAGRDARVEIVSGFVAPEFGVPVAPAEARARLGLPPAGKVVLVSGGGWGVGDMQGAVEEALAAQGVSQVVCLCGRNDELAAALARRFAADPRVRVEGFTEVMADWLAAGDALVHSTGGLTVLEAIMRGCPAISYGWGRGHVRLNNAAFRRFGLAEVAETRVELRGALAAALVRGRGVVAGFDGLPSAASFVLAAADAR